MAATTTAFEAEIIAGAFGNPDRGLMAGNAYRLRQLYLGGAVDPAAHTNAKGNPKGNAAVTKNAKDTSFDAITAP